MLSPRKETKRIADCFDNKTKTIRKTQICSTQTKNQKFESTTRTDSKVG